MKSFADAEMDFTVGEREEKHRLRHQLMPSHSLLSRLETENPALLLDGGDISRLHRCRSPVMVSLISSAYLVIAWNHSRTHGACILTRKPKRHGCRQLEQIICSMAANDDVEDFHLAAHSRFIVLAYVDWFCLLSSAHTTIHLKVVTKTQTSIYYSPNLYARSSLQMTNVFCAEKYVACGLSSATTAKKVFQESMNSVNEIIQFTDNPQEEYFSALFLRETSPGDGGKNVYQRNWAGVGIA